MYGIIYFIDTPTDNGVYPLLASDNKQIKLYETLAKADTAAEAFEAGWPAAECRVISIEGVSEL